MSLIIKRLASFCRWIRFNLREWFARVPMRFRQDNKKLTELVLYVAERWADAKYSGDTKLNKVLFAIDFDSYMRFGSPVVGVKFRKGLHGPRASSLLYILEEMKARRELGFHSERIGTKTQRRPIAKRPADLSLFSASELEIVNDWIDYMKDKSASGVRRWSHRFPFYKILSMDEEIPYRSIYWRFTNEADITEQDRRDAKSVALRYGSKHIPRSQAE